ncbi:hypothetical protein TNCV_1322881 [Trichonephila clavipes]|nr:hypothetical protein TNCV_1322881 [Trichonephila clavipes]
MEEAGLQHFKVNPRYNFVDPDTGVITQKIDFGTVSNGGIKIIGELTSHHNLDLSPINFYLKSTMASSLCECQYNNEDRGLRPLWRSCAPMTILPILPIWSRTSLNLCGNKM